MPNDLTTKPYRVLFFDELDEYESAIVVLSEHLKVNPTNGVAYNNRGLAYSEIGCGEEALVDFERAIQLSPKDPIPHLNRGDLYERFKPVGKLSEAIDDYSTAISIDPSNAAFHRCKAYACLKANRLKEAIDSFTSAIRLEPKFRQTYVDRGETYKKIGDHDKAELDFRKAAQLSQHPARDK